MIVTIGGQEVALKLPVRYRRTEVLSHDHGVAVVKADPNARVDELRVEVLHRRERLRRGQCGAAALRIAVIGRQSWYVYLESKHAIPASVDTMFPIASRRAVSMMSRLCWVAMFWRV